MATDTAATDSAAERGSVSQPLPSNATLAADEQWAWPFEEASADDRFAHMAGAHGFLFDGIELHAKLHEIGQAGRMPHEHLTPIEALMLREMR